MHANQRGKFAVMQSNLVLYISTVVKPSAGGGERS